MEVLGVIAVLIFAGWVFMGMFPKTYKKLQDGAAKLNEDKDKDS